MWLAHSFVKTPPDKFTVEIKPGKDPVFHDLVIKGFDTVSFTFNDAQLAQIGAAINAKSGSNEPF